VLKRQIQQKLWSAEAKLQQIAEASLPHSKAGAFAWQKLWSAEAKLQQIAEASLPHSKAGAFAWQKLWSAEAKLQREFCRAEATDGI
jgi:hypothetical protein